mgnify:CR=1 FL=1
MLAARCQSPVRIPGSVDVVVPLLSPSLPLRPKSFFQLDSDFAAAANAPEAYGAALRAARCLALTGLDLLADPLLLDEAREDHRQQVASRSPRIETRLIDGTEGS